jgi:hypothetical protein
MKYKLITTHLGVLPRRRRFSRPRTSGLRHHSFGERDVGRGWSRENNNPGEGASHLIVAVEVGHIPN